MSFFLPINSESVMSRSFDLAISLNNIPPQIVKISSFTAGLVTALVDSPCVTVFTIALIDATSYERIAKKVCIEIQNAVNSRYLEVVETNLYKFKEPEVQSKLHFGTFGLVKKSSTLNYCWIKQSKCIFNANRRVEFRRVRG